MTATGQTVPTEAPLPTRLARLLGSGLTAPVRIYRRRIYAQLIVSHLAVALLMAVLLTVGAFGLLLTVIIPNAAPPAVSSAGVAEQARLLSHLITADDVARLQSGDAGSVADRVTLTLSRAVAAGQPNEFPLPVPSTAGDIAVLEAPDGLVLSSSNPGGVPIGVPVDGARWPLLVNVTARYAASFGRRDAGASQFVTGNAPRMLAVAYTIPGSAGQIAGIVLLQRADIGPLSPMRPSRVATVLAAFAALAILLFTLPALLLAAPFGAWRARRVSRRLDSLEQAADAMARGDLARRVDPAGDDEIGRLGERFNAMAASLNAAERQRRTFVANVSHELRTPLAIVQGNVERLLQSAPAGATPPEELLTVQRESSILAHLIDDLFTLARLDEAVLPIEPARVAVATVAVQVVEGIRGPAWDQRRVVVRSLVDAGLPPALADPTRLRQILGNLVHNALRYTPEGGLVVIGAARRDDVVEVSVSDTGVGIAPEELELVFQRFYRGTQSRGVEDAGGLGLAIVKQLVEAQGGSITVESRAGQGTTFRFTLPVAHASG